MQHALYTGFVIHNRLYPIKRRFKYKINMFFLDVDDIDNAFKSIPFVSVNKWNILSFYRKNYLPSQDKSTIRDEVIKHLITNDFHIIPDKIFILTNLSYFGYCYNPVSFFYCYKDDKLIYLLAEVNNTPWNERFVYVEKLDNDKANHLHIKKRFHVSPFLPMNIEYSWIVNKPGEIIKIFMGCSSDKRVFNASLKVKKEKINIQSITKVILLSPFATYLVHFRIYLQALFLFIKKVPFYSHP